MTYIFYSKFIEQIFTLIFAIILVLIGWYAAGAVLGTAIGFLMALLGSYYLFKTDMKKNYLNGNYEPITFKEELGLILKIFKFSIPVVISGVAEIFLYDTGTFFIGMFLPTLFAGFYTNASAIARIPLIISNSISTSVLPATSEASSLKNRELLKLYIHQSYRYTTLTTLPVSAFIMVFAAPIMSILFGKEYVPGASALWILVTGMFFFSIYLIGSSMCQGLGKPQNPMYALIIGAIVNMVLSFILIPRYGIAGAAFATTISTCLLMIITMYDLTKITSIHAPYLDMIKMFIASFVMIGMMYVVPQNILGMIIGGIIGSILYLAIVVFTKAIKRDDVVFIEHIANKTGPLKKYLDPVVRFIYNYTD